MLIGIKIDKCNDCPFVKHDCIYNEIFNTYKYRFYCGEELTILAVHNSGSDIPSIEIPDWCPCRIEEEIIK